MAVNIPRGMQALAAVDMAAFTDAAGHKTTIDKVLRAEVSDPSQLEVVDFDAAAGTCGFKRLDATSTQVQTVAVICDARKQPDGAPDEVVELRLEAQVTTLDEDAVAGVLTLNVVPA